MQITIKLFANLRTGRFNEADHEFPDGTRVADVMDSLSISNDDIGVIILNHRHAHPGYPLQEGDCLALFPLVGGG
jgi:sulfur carrier protein ThiS